MLEHRVPPPVVGLVIAALNWLVAWRFPALAHPFAGGAILGGAIALAGGLIVLAGGVAFRQHRTTVNPLRPEASTAVVTSGVYRWTRNPMYLGMLLVLLGWATYLAHPGAIVLLPLFVAYIQRFQIVPEERALLAKFGPRYRDYMQRVRRWI